jgi:hypothetical protein
VLKPAQGIEDRPQPGKTKLFVELITEGFQVNIGASMGAKNSRRAWGVM